MSHRPYPNAARARRQLERHPLARPCPVCDHAIGQHAVEDGQRVCTRGTQARISCRGCAELWARMPAAAALQDFARAFKSRPVRGLPQPVLLGQR